MARAEKALMASVADLWRVAETNDTRSLEWILSSGIDVDARNEHGTTALMRAAYHGRLQMVEALIALGADPNAVRHDNFTPLTLAAFFGYAEIVRVLVQAGAETDRVTRNGTSARMWASARTFQGVAKYLDEAQPSPVDLKLEATEPQPEPTPGVETVDSDISQLDDSVGGDDLVDSAPAAMNETIKIPPRSMFARYASIKSAAFFAVLLTMSVAAVAMLSQRSIQKNSEKVEPTTTLSTSTNESSIDKVSSGGTGTLEIPGEQSPQEARTFEETKTRQDNGHATRSARTKFAEANDTGGNRRTLKPAPKNEIAKVPVASPTPVIKQPVSPLSTQLVSSPSKSATQPKVIQWP